MSRFLNALFIGAITATVAQAAPRENPKQESQPMLKAVVHVNFADAERQGHGLKNIANILKEAQDAQIEVVCHGLESACLSRIKPNTPIKSNADQARRTIRCLPEHNEGEEYLRRRSGAGDYDCSFGSCGSDSKAE